MSVEAALVAVRLRAEHPEGYRLFDYRPDVLVLVGGYQALLAIHLPTRADTHPDQTWCGACGVPFPCPTRRAIEGALSSIRTGPARRA